ncbi:gamma-butyrobetaine dioxygenase [Protopterus annectens]|uniref:gamma-butyrobetaine dioxygenase n=1 Tax=Protopterus annectens TaxID=7888 RepID=UPI001CFB3ECD|nr:gamma-butyrobetaine dioxygenase [Protopterus annectens]
MFLGIGRYLVRSKICQNGRLAMKSALEWKTQGSFFQHTVAVPTLCRTSMRIQKVEHLDRERNVSVCWEDGSKSLYPFIWLRDNCQCPECFLHSAKARKLDFAHLDVNTLVKKVALTEDSKVYIVWPDEHTSEFDPEWLKERCFSQNARSEMQKKICVTDFMYWKSDLKIPTISYEDVLKSDKAAYKWLEALRRVGVVLLKGAPAEVGAITKLGERIGFLRMTFYGLTWHVKDKQDANNVAYTAGPLGVHTDYPVLHHSPGVQMIHCIQPAKSGGDSEIVDGFYVAKKLRQEQPEAFQMLTSVLVNFVDTGTDYCDFHLHSKARIIQLDEKGEVVRINFNNATRDSVFDIPVEKVQPFYTALSYFVALLNKEENRICFTLEKGDVVVFDNWRVLHGRQNFESEEQNPRHLEGCYLDWDEVMSRFRILQKAVCEDNEKTISK